MIRAHLFLYDADALIYESPVEARRPEPVYINTKDKAGMKGSPSVTV